LLQDTKCLEKKKKGRRRRRRKQEEEEETFKREKSIVEVTSAGW